MLLRSTSPMDGSTLSVFDEWTGRKLLGALEEVHRAAGIWRAEPLARRCEQIARLGELLHNDRAELAGLITLEMGKVQREARTEIDDCVRLCEQLAELAPGYLAEESAGAATLRFRPFGTLLVILPRFAPFLDAFRNTIPALLAGNGIVLKHAAAVTQCALAIEELVREAVEPTEIFHTLILNHNRVPEVIASDAVSAVAFTGSRAAGLDVARLAGEKGKKVTLHLGGSDAFIILDDADLDTVVPMAVAARFSNAGQLAAGAKRFIVDQSLADDFVARLCETVESELIYGDPNDEAARFAPMASHELRDRIHRQVLASRHLGARVVTGCMPGEGPGAYYQASILDGVAPGMPACDEELFGPVAAIVRGNGDRELVNLANETAFGLGASIWSGDRARAEELAHELHCGQVFINAPVFCDTALPGAVMGESGFGCVTGKLGMREFTTAQAIIIG